MLVLLAGCGMLSTEPAGPDPIEVSGPPIDEASFAELMKRVPNAACEVAHRYVALGLADAGAERLDAGTKEWLKAWAGDGPMSAAALAKRGSVCPDFPSVEDPLHLHSDQWSDTIQSCRIPFLGLLTAEEARQASSSDAALLGSVVYRELVGGGVPAEEAKQVGEWIVGKPGPVRRPVLGTFQVGFPAQALPMVASAKSKPNTCRCVPIVYSSASGEISVDGTPSSLDSLKADTSKCPNGDLANRGSYLVAGGETPVSHLQGIADQLGGIEGIVATTSDQGPHGQAARVPLWRPKPAAEQPPPRPAKPAIGGLIGASSEPIPGWTVERGSQSWRVVAGGEVLSEGPPNTLDKLLTAAEAKGGQGAELTLGFPASTPWSEVALALSEVPKSYAPARFASLETP